MIGDVGFDPLGFTENLNINYLREVCYTANPHHYVSLDVIEIYVFTYVV
jgi:hypothetical protein